jgi:RNA polymerase primary sigma factor
MKQRLSAEEPRAQGLDERLRAGDASAPARKSAVATDTLTPYLNEMRDYDVLSAADELAIARRIEAFEIAHFRALLALEEALPVVAKALAPHFAPPKELTLLATKAAQSEAKSASPARSAVRAPRASTARGAKAVAPKAAARAVALAGQRLDALAEKLRELDVTRQGLFDADVAVREVFAGKRPHAKYLGQVARARQAQQAEKNRFMTANLRLVVSLARRYNQELLPLADLIQEGNLGLMRAVERFDHRRGFRFSTYAAWWIRHGLNRALSDKGRMVRVPVHLLDDAQRVAKARAELTMKTGEEPSKEALAEKTGLSEEKLSFIQTHAHVPKPASLDRPIGEDGDSSLLDVLAAPSEDEPEARVDAERWPKDLGTLLSRLPPIEAAILRFRYGLDDGEELTLREIGDKYNLSRERIRQLQEQALDKLRAELADGRAA